MAVITKVKCVDNTSYPTELTNGNIYNVSSETETDFFVTNDNTILKAYPKSVFNPYWDITQLKVLLPTDVERGAYGKDLFGNEYEITAIVDLKCALVSKNRENQNGLNIFYQNEFGYTNRLISTLLTYGIEVNYTPSETFSDRDDFYTYCVGKEWRVTYPYNADPIVTDTNGETVDMSLEGIVLNFS